MSASWQVPWISSVLARRQLSRLAPDLLVRTLLIVGVGEFLAMLLFQFLHVRMGLWAAFLDVFVLTLVTSGPLYWLVVRPAAQVVPGLLVAPEGQVVLTGLAVLARHHALQARTP